MVSFMILSHHRSGSNFLTEMLQRNSRISVVDEPMSMHSDFFKEVDLVRWTADECDPLCAGRFDGFGGARSFVGDLVRYLESHSGSAARGFKETILFEKLDWLLALLPDLRIVHLVRDPRAVVNSVFNHPGWRQWGYGETVPRYAARYEDGPDSLIWGDDLDCVVSSWAIRQFEAERAAPGLKHYLQVRLEDLVLDGDAAIDEICAFLDVEADQCQKDFLAASQKESKGGLYSAYRRTDRVLNAWRSELDADQVSRIETRLSGEMHRLGYRT